MRDEDEERCDACDECSNEDRCALLEETRSKIRNMLGEVSDTFNVPENSFCTGYAAVVEYQAPDGTYQLVGVSGDSRDQVLAPWRSADMLHTIIGDN